MKTLSLPPSSPAARVAELVAEMAAALATREEADPSTTILELVRDNRVSEAVRLAQKDNQTFTLAARSVVAEKIIRDYDYPDLVEALVTNKNANQHYLAGLGCYVAKALEHRRFDTAIKLFDRDPDAVIGHEFFMPAFLNLSTSRKVANLVLEKRPKVLEALTAHNWAHIPEPGRAISRIIKQT